MRKLAQRREQKGNDIVTVLGMDQERVFGLEVPVQAPSGDLDGVLILGLVPFWY